MKLKFLIPNLFVALLLLNSCSKEDAPTNDEATDSQVIQKAIFNLPENGRSPGGSTTMLQFNTFEDFLSTYETLENALENYQDVFYTRYEHLEDDAFKTM